MNVEAQLEKTDTKQMILNAAEELFAQNGYKGTTMRAITGKADVNLASVNYHFGSKRVLLEEVMKRRIQPLNQIRRERLVAIRDAAIKSGKRPDVESAMRAFIEPTLRFLESGPGARNFIVLIGRAIADPDDTVRRVFHRFMRSIFDLLYEIMCEALPDLNREIVFWRLHFAIGSMAHTMRLCGTDMGEMRQFNTDTDKLIDYLITFVSEGMKIQ